MKYEKKKTKNVRPILLIVAVIALVIVLAMLVMQLVNGDDTPASNPGVSQTTPSGSQSTGETEDQAAYATQPSETLPQPEDLEIETPYATLRYPGEWADFLLVEQTETDEDLTVTFSAKLESGGTAELFALVFGADYGKTAGVLVQPDGSQIAVNVQLIELIPDESWTATDVTVAYAMQEELNHILRNLPLTQPQEETVPPETEPAEMLIETPYCELSYPAQWVDYLNLEIDESDGYNVTFSAVLEGHEPVRLFTVHLGGTQGAPVTTFTAADGSEMELRLTVFELDLDSTWTDEEKTILSSMQEDLNQIIGKFY